MRKHKYRVWDVRKKLMQDWDALRNECNGGRVLSWMDGEDENKIVTQSTGLKDKNGVEIYEGDVVTESLYWDITKKDIVYFEVVFDRGKFLIKDRGGEKFEIGLEPKIVGNIYENPVLAK